MNTHSIASVHCCLLRKIIDWLVLYIKRNISTLGVFWIWRQSRQSILFYLVLHSGVGHDKVIINPNKFKIRFCCDHYVRVGKSFNYTWLIKIHCESYEKVGRPANQTKLPGYLYLVWSPRFSGLASLGFSIRNLKSWSKYVDIKGFSQHVPPEG